MVASTIITIVAIAMAIVARTWIAMTIGKRVPANLVAKVNINYKGHQGRSPPTALAIVLTTRSPRPGVVVVDPTAVVIRSPTPGFKAYPSPSIWRTPGPLAIAIRRPVIVTSQGVRMRPPDPTIFAGVGPCAVGVEIFRAPDVIVVVVSVIAELLNQEALAFVDPIVERVLSIGNQNFPFAGVWSSRNQFSRASVPKGEP